MKTVIRHPLRSVLVAGLALLALLVLPPAPAEGQTAPAKPKDRVVAVVDEDPILESDLDRAIALGFVQRRTGEAEPAFRRRALDDLINDRLRFHEVDRFGFEDVPIEDIDEQVEKMRARFGGPAEMQKVLREHGLTLDAVRRIVARQLLVWTYVKERLGPSVFVDAESINRHYRESLVPEMRRQGKTPPPVEDVRQDILAVLQEEKLNREIQKWTEELRRKADLALYLDNPLGKDAPLARKIDKKPARPG